MLGEAIEIIRPGCQKPSYATGHIFKTVIIYFAFFIRSHVCLLHMFLKQWRHTERKSVSYLKWKRKKAW
jgi:hypothetical protein